MLALQNQLAPDWKECLGLDARHAPELYQDATEVDDVPHARPIRTALHDLGAAAVFCVQHLPTAVFFATESMDPTAIARLHSDLWNQGLASVLAVVCGETIRIYSLAATPAGRSTETFDETCLIEVLHQVRDALALRNLIYGMESGRYWKEHGGKFDANQRVDGVLLGNLKQSHDRLQDRRLAPAASQALLMQTMFIAYLEDRKIIDARYIEAATDGAFSTFAEILNEKKVHAFYGLFRSLRRDFNGDLFRNPCSFDDVGPRLQRRHLEVLARFRSGKEEMGPAGGQFRFWGYNFEFIPVELISAVYDKFLNEQDQARKGQFHTPMHLASSIVSQIWDDPDVLDPRIKTKGKFLDPACGSGIFLVCLFKRLCEQWRYRQAKQNIRWDSLRDFLARLCGWDIDASAVRVAAFSLYVALLEEARPPDIRNLMRRGKLLPSLWGKTLRQADFFHMEATPEYDVVIGNPPWRRSDTGSAGWCERHGLPAPDKQAVWGFLWKALRHLKEDGRIAFLLPAMSFLHNHSKKALEARSLLFQRARVRRIVNYADLRFQLFSVAVRPASLFIAGLNPDAGPYEFDYWVPKASPSSGATRLVSINEIDKKRLNTVMVERDPLEFKKRMWMTSPESKLFRYLSTYPRLRARVAQHGRSNAVQGKDSEPTWKIGQGFQPVPEGRLGDASYDQTESEVVAAIPFLPAKSFRIFAPNLAALVLRHDEAVRRRGFDEGFDGPRLLISQGIGNRRLKSAYSETPFTFQHAIQAITVPDADRERAKLLAALLNSKLLFWWAFHSTSSIGSERPKVHQDQLLDLPFPAPEETPEPQRSHNAAKRLIALIDGAPGKLDNPMQPPNLLDRMLVEVDRLACDYFALTERETLVVEETWEYVVPALQPGPSAFPTIWEQPSAEKRREYAQVLTSSLDDWTEADSRVSVTLVAKNHDLAVLRLRLCAMQDRVEYREESNEVGRLLVEVARESNTELPGNIHQVSNLRMYAGDDMYMVKPNSLRFWMRSAAQDDAEQVVVDVEEFRRGIGTVRNIDDDVVASLKAKANHRSFEGEIRHVLAAHVSRRTRITGFRDRTAHLSAQTEDRPQTDSVTLLREDRDR